MPSDLKIAKGNVQKNKIAKGNAQKIFFSRRTHCWLPGFEICA